MIPADKILEILGGTRCRAYIDRVEASAFGAEGRTNDAENALKEAVGLLEQSSPEHSDLAATLEDYGRLMRNTNRAGEAAAIDLQVRAIRADVTRDRMHPRM